MLNYPPTIKYQKVLIQLKKQIKNKHFITTSFLFNFFHLQQIEDAILFLPTAGVNPICAEKILNERILRQSYLKGYHSINTWRRTSAITVAVIHFSVNFDGFLFNTIWEKNYLVAIYSSQM